MWSIKSRKAKDCLVTEARGAESRKRSGISERTVGQMHGTNGTSVKVTLFPGNGLNQLITTVSQTNTDGAFDIHPMDIEGVYSGPILPSSLNFVTMTRAACCVVFCMYFFTNFFTRDNADTRQ